MNACQFVLSSLVVVLSSLFYSAGVGCDDAAKVESGFREPLVGREAGQVRDDNGLQMKLVWCSPGTVTMQESTMVTEPTEDHGAKKRNRIVKITPVKVFLSRGYWIGMYEITQLEWKQLMGTEPWKGKDFTKEGDDFPATFVNIDDVTKFCSKLTTQERDAGRLDSDWKYSLPTEAQWERACRAQTETRFSFGDEQADAGEFAWFNGNTAAVGETYPHRVGQKKSNPWGLFDIHGNVWEWTRDVYAVKLPGGRDPEATDATQAQFRVIRGGGWTDSPDASQCAYRRRWAADARQFGVGFRIVLGQ